MDVFDFKLKVALQKGERLEIALTKTLEGNQMKLEPYFRRLIAFDDTEYTIVPKSLVVSACVVSGDDVQISGQFASNYFAACRGVNSTDKHDFKVTFKYRAGCLFYNGPLPLAWNVEN